jgi:hypothetical protein
MRHMSPLSVITGGAAEPAVDVLVAGQVLSTDFLNRYNEALMLIEMAGQDPGLIDDLRRWKPASYPEHFALSQLRCADGAIAAFRALPEESRGAFASLCRAMDQLVATVITALTEIRHPGDAVYIIDIAATSFRNLLTRATAFINSGGDMAEAAYSIIDVQDAVDRIVAA